MQNFSTTAESAQPNTAKKGIKKAAPTEKIRGTATVSN
jgi:hypothetical protein